MNDQLCFVPDEMQARMPGLNLPDSDSGSMWFCVAGNIFCASTMRQRRKQSHSLKRM
jgi:hypothetical protein